jgi:hypothetical protein
MNCNEARELLSAGAGDAAARAHLEGCAACRARLVRLSAAVLSRRADEISCAECRSGMHAAALPERPAAEALPPLVAAHLEGCPECRAELGLLGLSLRELSMESRPTPPAYPPVDTGFLRGPAQVERSMRPMVLAALLALALLLGAMLRWRIGGDEGQATATIPAGAAIAPKAGPDADREAGIAELGSPEQDGKSSGQRLSSAQALAAGTAAARTARAAASRTERAAQSRALPGQATQPPAGASAVSPTPAYGTGLGPGPSETPAGLETPENDDPPPVNAVRNTDPPPAPTPSPTPPMETLCYVEGFGPTSSYLDATCSFFPALSAYDSFVFESTRDARWTFSLCARTELDTILALYRESDFDPGEPCARALAQNDDYCGLQSRITVDLPPGRYRLVLSEKSGDLSDTYAIRVGISLAGQPQACPRLAAPILPSATDPPSAVPTSSPTSLPSATASASPTPSPGATNSATVIPTAIATATTTATPPAPWR